MEASKNLLKTGTFPDFVFVGEHEEAIRRHRPALGRGILSNSSTIVRRLLYAGWVWETQNGNLGSGPQKLQIERKRE